MRAYPSRIFLSIGSVVYSILMVGCGAANNGSPGPTSGSNVQAISVNGGPVGVQDVAFTSVTVCSPGSTSNCQTISGILVDTGSYGLRILSSALSVSLPAQTNSSGNPIAECVQFASNTFTWGAVQIADVKISGEQANSLPIQVIGTSNFPNIPNDCASQGSSAETLADLNANGIVGVGSFIQDCGPDCVTSGQPSLGHYYACITGVCTDTTESLAEQVQNPVASFATDNNGVIIELPAVTGPLPSVTGSLIFGIGTQSNNGLGGAAVFGTDQSGFMTTTYNSHPYTSFLDTGSNGIFFLDAPTTGLPLCTGPASGLYCPTSTQSFTVTNNAAAGTIGGSARVMFTVGNGSSLIIGNNAAINGIAGPAPALLGGVFDFGLPFFFGRHVYTAIEGKSTPGGTGPYIAY